MLIHQFSKAGRLHGRSPERNQDAVLFRQTARFSAIALADGVSMCAEARQGAEIANQSILDFLLCPEEFAESSCCDMAKQAISFVFLELERFALSRLRNIADYSSALAAVRLEREREKLTLFHLGDSLILSLRNGSCNVLSMPGDSRNGCCCTTTRNVFSVARFCEINSTNMDAVMICSDGAWRLMYEKTRMKREVRSILANADYDCLERRLTGADGSDDCSFIVMDWKQERSVA